MNNDHEPLTVKQFFTIFDDVWRLRYGDGYERFTAADAANAKRVIKQFPKLTRDELETWCERYLATDDDFVLRNAHKFDTFFYRLNAYRVRPTTNHTNLESAAADFVAGQG